MWAKIFAAKWATFYGANWATSRGCVVVFRSNKDLGVMAGKPIDIMELKQLIQLKLQGTSNRVTASLLHVDRKTVNKYVSLKVNS